MLTMLKSYFSCLSTLHDELKKTLLGLPQEALDWTPGEHTLSLVVVAVHVAGAERYWIGDVVGQGSSHRDREAEFHSRGLGAQQLQASLDAALEHSRAVLEVLALEDLDDSRVSSRDGSTVSVSWALMHTLEHTATHLGHAQLTRQLWDQRHT